MNNEDMLLKRQFENHVKMFHIKLEGSGEDIFQLYKLGYYLGLKSQVADDYESQIKHFQD